MDFILKNGYQIYKNCMHIFPYDYFSPLQYGKIIINREYSLYSSFCKFMES